MLLRARLARSTGLALGDYRLKPRPGGETLRSKEPDRRGGDATTPEDVSLKLALLDQPVDEPRGNAENAAGLGQCRVRRGERWAVVQFGGTLRKRGTPPALLAGPPVEIPFRSEHPIWPRLAPDNAAEFRTEASRCMARVQKRYLTVAAGKPNVLSRRRRGASRAALLRCSDARYVRSVVIQLGLVDINRRIGQDLTTKLFNLGCRIFERRRELSAGKAVQDHEIIDSNEYGISAFVPLSCGSKC